MPALKDRRIAFLESHRRSPYTTFNASYALIRLDHLNVVLKKDIPFEKQIGIDDELFLLRPYYLVALCTCFEWHARSRLRDFVEYYSEKLDVSEKIIPKDLSTKIVIEGIKQGSTIGELVAASLRINSVEEYISIMESGFGLADLGRNFNAALESWKASVASEMPTFFDVFVLRHSIVHEMPLALFENRRIGPLVFLDQIMLFAKLSHELIEALEKLILEKMPLDFPDRLVWLESNRELKPMPDLVAEIDSLEKIIAEGIDIDDRDRFKAVTAAWRKYYEQEENGNNTYIPHYRDSNDREFFRRQICLDRIRYLRRIIKDYGYSEAKTP